MLVQIILILGLYFSREQLKRLQNVKYDEICSIHGPIIISDKWSCEIPAFSVVEISPGDTGEAQDRFSVSFFSLKDEYENGTEHVFSAVGPGAQEEKFELFNFRSMKINCINCSLPTYNSKIIFYQRSFYNWPISLLIGLLISIPFIVWFAFCLFNCVSLLITSIINLGKYIVLSSIKKVIIYVILIALLIYMIGKPFIQHPIVQETKQSSIDYIVQQYNQEKDKIVKYSLPSILSQIKNSFKDMILWYYNIIKDILLAFFLSEPEQSTSQKILQITFSHKNKESNFSKKPLLLQIIQLIYANITALIKEGWRLICWVFSINGTIRSAFRWFQRISELISDNNQQSNSETQTYHIIDENNKQSEQKTSILYSALIFIGIILLFFGKHIFNSGILITPLLLIAVLYTHVQGNLFAFRSGHDLISKISEQILIVSESINDDNIDEQQSGFIELFASELDTTFIVIACIFIIAIYLLFHNAAFHTAYSLVAHLIYQFLKWIFVPEIPALIIDNPGMEKDSDTIRFLKNQKRNEENKRIEKDKQLSQIINRGRMSIGYMSYIILILCFSLGVLITWAYDEQLYQRLTIARPLLTFFRNIINFIELQFTSKDHQHQLEELDNLSHLNSKLDVIMKCEVLLSIIFAVILIAISLLTHMNIIKNQQIYHSLSLRNKSLNNNKHHRNIGYIIDEEQDNQPIIDIHKALLSLNTSQFLIFNILLIFIFGDIKYGQNPNLISKSSSQYSYIANSPYHIQPFWIISLFYSPFKNSEKTIIISRLITDLNLFINTSNSQIEGHKLTVISLTSICAIVFIIISQIRNKSSNKIRICVLIMRIGVMIGIVIAMHATYSTNNQYPNYLYFVHQGSAYMTFTLGNKEDFKEKLGFDDSFQSFNSLSATLSSYSAISVSLLTEIGLCFGVIQLSSWIYDRKIINYIKDLKVQNGEINVDEIAIDENFSFLESITQINLLPCLITALVGILLLYFGYSYRQQYNNQIYMNQINTQNQQINIQCKNDLYGILTGCNSSGIIKIDSRQNITLLILFVTGVLMQCLLTIILDWIRFRHEKKKIFEQKNSENENKYRKNDKINEYQEENNQNYSQIFNKFVKEDVKWEYDDAISKFEDETVDLQRK